MISQELLQKLDIIDTKLREIVPAGEGEHKEQVLARAVKLGEEVGELNNEILLKFYKRKKTQFSNENLRGEFADVIFTAILLSKAMGVDINQAIEEKIKIIEERGGV